MPGSNSYTEKEEKTIEELKRRIIDELPQRLLEDETLFYRFLKARDFNVEKAETMLRKHLSEREMYEFEDVIKNYVPPEHMNKYIPSSFVGFDKEGFVVRYIDVGGADMKGSAEMFTSKQMLQFTIDYLERDCNRLLEQTKKFDRYISQLVVIMNMDKLSLFQITSRKVLEFALKLLTFFQDNYPERIKAIYVINASSIYNMLFSICKRVVAEAVIQKIKVFGRSGWKEFLLNEIDSEVLPAFLGGSRTDPDGSPLCNSFIVHGQKIPEELFPVKNKLALKYEKDAKNLTVSRFSSSDINVNIFEPNTYIKWKFETNRDIGFGLYYKDNSRENSKQEVLIPLQRIDTAISSEDGLYKCDKPGIYTITFDNSYSLIHSKEIYYRIQLIKPQDMN